jgi:hypothetical protein
MLFILLPIILGTIYNDNGTIERQDDGTTGTEKGPGEGGDDGDGG